MQEGDDFAKKLIVRFFGLIHFPSNTSMGKCLHALDVYGKCLIWEGHGKKISPPK